MNFKRFVCPDCNREVLVNSNNQLMWHFDSPAKVNYCSGSRKPANGEVNREPKTED